MVLQKGASYYHETECSGFLNKCHLVPEDIWSRWTEHKIIIQPPSPKTGILVLNHYDPSQKPLELTTVPTSFNIWESRNIILFKNKRNHLSMGTHKLQRCYWCQASFWAVSPNISLPNSSLFFRCKVRCERETSHTKSGAIKIKRGLLSQQHMWHVDPSTLTSSL